MPLRNVLLSKRILHSLNGFVGADVSECHFNAKQKLFDEALGSKDIYEFYVRTDDVLMPGVRLFTFSQMLMPSTTNMPTLAKRVITKTMNMKSTNMMKYINMSV